MKKLIFITVAVVATATLSAQTWSNIYQAGTNDANGNFRGGNEIMQIVAHKGKLYAGNSQWQEFDTINNPRSCEILRLDTPNAQWQVDQDFTTNNLRIGAMKSFVFNSNYLGQAIVPDTLLITIPNDNTGKVTYCVRNDVTNNWTLNTLATLGNDINCRALGFHKDVVNNVCYLFAGLMDYGIFSGRYNPAAPGKIQWKLTPEFVTPPNERVMGFTVCNNILYAATSDGGIGHIYKRTDGTVATWTLIKTTTGGSNGEDLRGLSSIPNPNGTGAVLWYSWNKKASRLDPNNNYTETVEYAYTDTLTNQLGIQVQYILAAYNDNIPVFNPTNSNEDVRLIGFEIKYNAAALANDPRPNWNGWATDGQYYERHQNGSNISYVRRYIVNNTPLVKDSLIATRTICVSPFVSDSNKVLYAGGMDCNSIPMSRQAWIYRGDYNSFSTNDSLSLTVNNGFGSGKYPAGDSVFVLANPTPENFIFERWNTTVALSDTFCVATVVENLSSNAVLTPVYAFVPEWIQTAEVINGSNVYTYFPTQAANLKGLILFFHGSNGNGSSWFTKLENKAFLNYAVAKGYAVLSTESVDRITGGLPPWQWSNNTTINGNPDIQNINSILNSYIGQGKISATTPLFGVGFSQGSGFCSIIAALKNFNANALGATPGINAVIAQTLSPTYWMASRQDENADPLRLEKCIANYNTLVSRGIDAALHIHEPFPVTPNRFWRIEGMDSILSSDVYDRLRNNNYLDDQGFINFNPDANTVWKSALQPTYNAVLDDIEDQVIICFTEHKFHSDQMYYVIRFFDQYALGATSAMGMDDTGSNIKVYPNPFHTSIQVLNLQGNETFMLSNALGETVYEGRNIGEQDFSALQGGIYFLTIYTGSKTTPQTIKMAKN